MFNTTMKKLTLPTLLLLLWLTPLAASAWDGVGHRLTAAVALNFLSESTQTKLLTLLQSHPRYQTDFIDAMPDFVASADDAAKAQWLLGQAAYWPDIARGLPEEERQRFNRGWWHYTDGAWIRDSAPFQGNIYINIPPADDIPGVPSASVRQENAVSNIVTGIDFNTWVLANPQLPDEERAVALCWVLHLMGDIHQPMHTGSLFSETTFVRGDLGGNRIPIGERNLHAIWDQALREDGITDSLPILIQQVTGFSQPKIQGVDSDWTQWMNESRQILQSVVYTQAIRSATEAADAANAEEIVSTELSAEYLAQMKQIAQQRLGLAGLRLAIWFENSLPN
jgi:hypothetical protein